MDIISRKDAILRGESKYFTGNVCKNGHLTYRYTQSGACSDCIRGRSPFSKVESPEILAARKTMEAAKIQFNNAVENYQKLVVASIRMEPIAAEFVNFRVHVDDIELFKATAVALAKVRTPGVELSDLQGRKGPHSHAGQTCLLPLRTYPGDVDTLRGMCSAWLNARWAPGEIDVRRDAILRNIRASADQ